MKSFYIYIFLLTFAIPGSVVAITGGIDTPYSAKVCHDTTCTSPTPGTINFKPTGVTPVVVDSVTGLSGKIWGNEIGWINLNPTGAGVTFLDTSTGVLTGKAWSQVSGWINFAPTGQQVRIDPNTGELSGWAWTGGPQGGWIKFDCTNAETCVKTTWVVESARATTGNFPLNIFSNIRYDVCKNESGIQQSIPSGYTVDAKGNCIVVVDVCPNILGDQASIPKNFELTSWGSCINYSDYCQNIEDDQKSMPEGMIIDEFGNCVLEPIDLCSNISGYQKVVPEGFYLEGGICIFERLAKIEGRGNKNMVTDTVSQTGETPKNTVRKAITSVTETSNKVFTDLRTNISETLIKGTNFFKNLLRAIVSLFQ